MELKQSILSGWDIDSLSRFTGDEVQIVENPQPISFQGAVPEIMSIYEKRINNNPFVNKEMLLELVDCEDIEYNGAQTNTYYPPRKRFIFKIIKV